MNLPQREYNHSQIQCTDQSINDSFFSIDISKSIQSDRNQATGKDQIQLRDSSQTVKSSEVAKKPKSTTIATGINSVVWMELDDTKHKLKTADDRDAEIVRLKKSSIWSKFLTCF